MTTRARPMSNKQQRAAIGIDIGGTKIAAGVVLWPSGAIACRRTVPTLPKRGGKAVLETTRALASELKTQARASNITIQGIGVGVPELVDQHGNLGSHQTIDWRRTPVQRSLSKIAPARVESDVRAAALGEAIFGAGKNCGLFTYVTVGTGISYCLMQDGRPLRGARGNAITFASSPLTHACESCGAISRPILEEFASGPALVSRYKKEQRSKATPLSNITCADIFRRAKAGDRVAKYVLESAGHSLGVNVAFLVNVLDPEMIVVGGGVGLAGGVYWTAFLRSCREHIYADNARSLPIVRARLGTDAGVVGAAASIFTMKEGT